jgi:hypothetical protein
MFKAFFKQVSKSESKMTIGRIWGVFKQTTEMFHREMSRNLPFQTLSNQPAEDPRRIGYPQGAAKPAIESVQFGQFRGCAKGWTGRGESPGCYRCSRRASSSSETPNGRP